MELWRIETYSPSGYQKLGNGSDEHKHVFAITCLKTLSLRNLRETPNDISKRKSIDLQKLHLPWKVESHLLYFPGVCSPSFIDFFPATAQSPRWDKYFSVLINTTLAFSGEIKPPFWKSFTSCLPTCFGLCKDICQPCVYLRVSWRVCVVCMCMYCGRETLSSYQLLLLLSVLVLFQSIWEITLTKASNGKGMYFILQFQVIVHFCG